MTKNANKELDLAWKFVNYTGKNIFLTGKAGTGKTTFLHKIKKESLKKTIVVAPTGVAAINAGGVTIHSFFQMPFGPIIPDEEIKRDFKQKFNKKKIDLIRSMDLLIIDEISMVRADLLDGIDQILRKYKNKNRVFGGVQVLMIGDMQQLAPVVREQEKNIIGKYYETPYFFSSRSFKQAEPVFIELKEIFRQQDMDFINILNGIRQNNITDEMLAKLNHRYIPDFVPPKKDSFIILTTHNYKADKINQENLNKIPEKSHFFKASIEGDFPQNALPNDLELELKVGEQVMFNKNDSSFEKRYYNGKIGTITEINSNKIYVKCPGDEQKIEVQPEVWNYTTYDLDTENNTITEKIKGSFSQIPLRPAWAITIHKSQGLTFDKAIIDAGQSFAHGQTYVALSRCKTLEGLVLKTPVTKQSIITDYRVESFNSNAAKQQPDENSFNQAKTSYQFQLLNEIFDFSDFRFPINRLLKLYQENQNVLIGNISAPITIIKDEGLLPLLKITSAFLKQLSALIQSDENLFQERFIKGVNYYLDILHNKFEKPFDDLSFDTDNKAIMKDFLKSVDKLNELIHKKLLILDGLQDGFEMKKYLDLRMEADLLKLEKNIKLSKKDISKLLEHPDLYDALKELRNEFAQTENVHHYQIFTQESLYQMCKEMPVTINQLKKINGIGKVRLKKYGNEIIEVIKSYCVANRIPLKDDEPEIKQEKKNTKNISLEMFQKGMTPNEIAKERNLAISTIIGHLSYFIPTGEIKITDLINEKRYLEIKNFIEKNPNHNGLSELRKISNNKYDFGELRLVLNTLNNNE